ncbi:Ctf8p and Ctf18p associating protein [Tieghemiomyces parasiticus]|uniref:Ctf8p and Ctf18p associating protein n=1 Tax=Tieghemiomyces parasiticus TaxID=78921 RepID=A0A9W8AC74_9FUNG|nr:Ctf8p and Ctf18p associating protein [Tieghemiomyces parasiticus]
MATPTIKCRVVIADDFHSVSAHRLLEIPPELADWLEQPSTGESGATQVYGSDTRVLELRGLEGDTAVLCTPEVTYEIRQVNVSNSLLIVGPRQDANAAVEVAMQLDDDGEDAGAVCLPTLEILGAIDSHLEIEVCPPRPHRLREILQVTSYRGPDYESLVLQDVRPPTWEEIRERVQMSDTQLQRALRDAPAILIDGHYRLLEGNYLRSLLQLITAECTIQDIPLDRIPVTDCARYLADHDVSPDLLAQVLWAFAPDTHVTYEPRGVYTLDPRKYARFMALQLFEAEADRQWRRRDFLGAWRALVPECLPLESGVLEDLALSFVNERDQLQYLRYFPTANLPADPVHCFRVLFQAKEKWAPTEMLPYVRHLSASPKKLDALILKYCRSSKVRGEVMYSSRVRTH